MSLDDQPISGMVWVHRDELTANDWNPNNVMPPEMKLLEQSILVDGWTQPIVCQPPSDTPGTEGEREIIDGFHRWTISGRPKVYALTNGMVPVVTVCADAAGLRASTVRHNRARGTHHVLRMADIVADLVQRGVDPEVIRVSMGMDHEELRRLTDRGSMILRGARPEGVGKGWVPGAPTIPNEPEFDVDNDSMDDASG